MRRKEIDLDNMKQLQGYQGVPRTVTKQQEPKDTYVAPLTKTSTSAPSLSNPTTVPFSMVPDKPALPNLKQTQTDAFGTPFKPFLETPKLGTDNNIPNSGFQLLKTPPPVKNITNADGTSAKVTLFQSSVHRERVGITLQEQAQEHVPQILKKRQVSEEAMKQLDESAAQVRQQKLTPEQQAQFDKSYNEQRTKLQTDIDNTHKFDTDIAYYHFNNKVSSIAQNAYGTDKDGNVVIPNQNANKNQLDASFWSTLKTIVDHEKKSGKLQKDITEQDVLDGVLGSRYLIHDIMGDEYSDLRNRYSDFFDKYIQTKSDLGILDGQYKAKGGKEEQVPITNNVEQGKQGTGQPFMKGVVVPKDEVTWDSARRINQDLTQGASNVTLDALGQAGAFVAGMFGDSYQHQQEVKGTIERGGSRAGRFVSGVASIIPDHIKDQMEATEATSEAVRSDWQNIVGLFTVGETYRSPTASELHGTMRNMAATEQQQKLVEATDSPARDVVQAVSEITMGIGFGDFNAAGKVSTGLGKTANFVKNAATLRKTADNLDDATVLANRVMNTLEKERKLGKNFDELVAGTNEGRKATLMARMMLPPSATASEAAHLATTLAIQHVAQHAENMSVDDIKEGVQTGTIFALMNVGLSKLFGGVAQRIAVAQGTGKGLEATEIANKINSYKRIGTLFGQMATQPVQSKVAQAMNDGHWEKVFDPNEYMNRQAVIDIAMGGLGIKDLFKSVARTPAEREKFNAMYEDAIDRISKGEATPEQIKQEVKNVVEEIRTEVPEPIVEVPNTALVKYGETPDLLKPKQSVVIKKDIEAIDALREKLSTNGTLDNNDIKFLDRINVSFGEKDKLYDKAMSTIGKVQELQRQIDTGLYSPDQVTMNELIIKALNRETDSYFRDINTSLPDKLNIAKRALIQEQINTSKAEGDNARKVANESALFLHDKLSKAEKESNRLKEEAYQEKVALRAKLTKKVGTTELGTEIVEKPSAASFIESKFTELGIDPKTATARDLGSLLESFNDGSPFDAFLAKHAAGKGGDTPVQLRDVVAIGGKEVPGKYSVDSKGNRTLSYAKGVSPERTPQLIRHELMHNYGNKAIDDNINGFADELQNILNTVVSHPELDAMLADYLGADAFTDVTEQLNQVKGYHLSPETTSAHNGVANGHLKEFLTGLTENFGIAEAMKQIPYTPPEGTKVKKGTIRTLWDKFIDVMSRMIPRLKGTTQEQHRTAFEAYYEALSKVPVEGETSTVTPEESGAMINTLHQITGKKIQQEDLTEENMLLTRIIQEAVAREQYPNKFLGEVIEETKARQDESINSLIDETVLQNLERNAKVPEGRKYNELNGQEQIRAIANGIIERQSKTPSDTVANIDSIYEGTNDKLVAVADGDITAITGLSQEFQTAAEIIRTVKGLHDLKQADNYITELTKHGDPKIYLEGMALLRADVEKTQPELLDSWDDAVRSIWRNRQNSQPIDNIRMELVVDEDDERKVYRFIATPITETRTENGKVKKHRNVAAGLNRFKAQLVKDKAEAGYAQAPTMQKALQEMTTKVLKQIHETKVNADGKYSFKSGYAVDDTAIAYQGELAMLRQNGTYMLKIGNKGGMLIDMRDTVDYVMEEGGKFAVARLTELNDGNLWKALDSHELWNDGITGSRFDKLSRVFSAVKLHHKVNVEKVPVEQLEFKDIVRLSVKDNGYQTKDGTMVSYDIAKANFDKNKEKLVPMFAGIADKLNIMHKGVGTNERITPYAYRTKPENPKDKLDAHYKELLTQINALYHWSVDPAGSQYFTDPIKGLPKIHEKYYGLLTGGSYVTFKRWADALVGMGYDDWSSKTDNDLEHIHAIHTIDDVKTIKFAVLDADIFEDDEELKALLGKENTDGALFVFHKEHFKALQALSGNKEAGHVKTALATTKDGFSQMNKGDTHFIDIDYIKQIVAEVPELLPMYQRLITMADGLKRQGLFGVAMQTTMKGKGTYRLGMDGDVAFNNKRQAVGVKKLDGTIDLDKEKALALNLEAQMNILNGGAVPNFAVLDMPLHGEDAISFVNTSGANSRTQSPGISVNMMPRSVHGGGKYWGKVAKHINAYEDNLIKAANNLTSGYADVVAMLNAPGSFSEDGTEQDIESLNEELSLLNNLSTVKIGKSYKLEFESGGNEINVKMLSFSKFKDSKFKITVQNQKNRAEYTYVVDSMGYGDKVTINLATNEVFEVDESYKKRVENHINRLQQKLPAYTNEQLKNAGTFLYELADYIKSKEASEFSGVASSREMSEKIELCITKDGLARPELVPGLLAFRELFYKQEYKGTKDEGKDTSREDLRPLALQMLGQRVKDLYDGKGLGATATAMPDITARADFENLIKTKFRYDNREYKQDLGLRLGADMTLSNEEVYEEAEVIMGNLYQVTRDRLNKLYADQFDPTGAYAKGSNGATISRDIFNKLNKQLRRRGLPMLDIGSKVFLKVTPADDVSSFAPFVLMGLTETPNTIMANREYVLQVTGKDFDGDTMGIFVDSLEWHDEDGTNHFDLLHNETTALGMHKGSEKKADNQSTVMEAAVKYRDGISEALRHVVIGDGTNPRSIKVPINPMHPDHAEYLLNTTRDIGTVIDKIHEISQAFQNTIRRFVKGSDLAPAIPLLGAARYKDKAIMRYTPDPFMELIIVYDPLLMGNYSLVKQLGAVDMYMPQGIDIDDLLYGTVIAGINTKKGLIEWSKLDDVSRKFAIAAFNKWSSTASGVVIKDIMKGKDGTVSGVSKKTGEDFKIDKVEQHFKEVGTDGESISSKMLVGLRAKMQAQVNPIVLYDMVSQGTNDLQDENKPLVEKIKPILDKFAYAMRHVISKFSIDGQVNDNNYIKAMTVENYAYSNHADKTPQNSETKITMGTNLFYAIQTSTWVPIPNKEIFKSKNGIVSISSDNSGLFFKVRTIKGVQEYYLKDVVKRNGTIDPTFASELEAIGTSEALLFRDEVKASLSVSPLSTSEAGYLVGAILANVGHYYERMTGGVSNADIFVGTALVSELPTMISKNKGSTGTFLNHKQYNENITSDPMTVISGAKAYGVVPLVGMPGEKLSDKVQYMVGSQSRYLADEGSSGAVTIKQPTLSKIGQWMKDTFNGEVDIRNPQHIQRAADELPAIIKEQYGELVTPERLDEVFAALHHTLYQDHKTASERDMTADESNKRFLTAMAQLDRSLRNSRQAIKKAGGIRAWVQGIKDFFHFDEVTPTEANTATNVAHRLGEDRMTAVANQPLGVALEFQADGSISTTEKVLSDKLDMELLTYQQVLDGTKGVFNYVEPHRTASSDIDGFVNRLDNDMGAIKKVLTKGTEYSPADYGALVDALESSEVPELNLRITATGTGGAYDVTAFITVNGIEHSFKLSDTNLRGTFNTALKDLQLGHVTGAVRSKVRFSKNYDSDTPDIEKRRAFLTEATSGKTQWNAESQQNEYVQGAAYSKARDNAMEVGDKLYLHDIETKVWYEEDPGKGTLVQIDKPPAEVMNNNYLHITSKLENHPTLTQEVHHNYIDELMDMYMITPTSRTKEESIDTQVQKIASEGREDDIKRAISGMIMAKMVQTKLTMSQVEFMANIDWIMNRDKDIAPQHLKDYVAKVGKDMTDEIARRTTTADFTDIVRDMSTIEGLDQISNVLEVLDTFVKVNAEDDAAWQNITAALYKHEDYLTPIPRYQLSKQIKNVKGTFNREIAKLEKAMGKNGERDYYKKEPISLSKDQENFGIIDILKVLREDKYVSIGIESLLDKYSKSGDFMHQILDYVTTTLYLQSPDPNDIAHRNILHLMNTSGKRGVLRTVNEDMNEWKKDARRMGVTSDLFHNIDPGTIFDIQLLDNVGEPLLLKDQSYLGTVMRDVVDTKGNKLGNKPFIMALDRSHTQVTWIDLDNVQQMNSAIANDKDMKAQARTFARNTELQTAVMKLVKGKPLVKHTRKGEIDSIEENGTAIQQFGDIEYVQPLETNTFKQRKGLLDTYQVADAESQNIFSRYRTFGESMQVAATYLHQNAALGFAAAALYSIGKGTFAAATGDLTLAGQYMGAVLKASGKLASKLGMPILQNYIGTSSLVTRTTEKTYFGGLINDIWNSNTGLQSASRMFSKRPFDTQQSEMTANIVSRRIKAGAVGSFTEQVKASGMDYVKKHEGFKGTALARMFSDPKMVRKFEQIEKDVTASLPAAAKMQEGIRKLATTATAELMKDLESVNATIRIVDGNAKVFIDGKTIDQFRSDMVSFVAGMTAITAGTLLQKSEVHSAGITGTVNENNVHDFVPEYDYLRPHQQAEVLNSLSNFTLGNYERPVYQLKGWGRGLTIFQAYGAPKVHYQQQGLVLRDNLFQATKNATGTQNIGTFNSGGMIVKNPRKQIRAWLINGLIVRTIGAGIIAGTSSFVAPNLLNDMVQAHPVSAVLYAGWNVAIDAMKYDDKSDYGKTKAEGNVKTNLDGVSGSMGMGMGQKSMTGVMTYGLQLAKDLVDDGEITNLEQDSELNQAWTVTKNLMNTFPVTAPLSSAVSAAEEVRKVQKDVEE